MKYFCGIDNGGTNTKAAIFDENGSELASFSVETPRQFPAPGWEERDMDELWARTSAAVRGALERSGIDNGDIAGVGCTGHGKGLYPWGKDGRPAYNAIASTDRRALDIVNEWDRTGVTERVMDRIMQPVSECQPVALLAWLKREKPEVHSNIQWIFEAKDYIRFRLTGEARAEMTDYSGTSLMDIRSSRFDRGILDAFGIGEMAQCLPETCLSYDLCGHVTAEAAEATGLREGTPVCGGMFDIDACAIAMGVTRPESLCAITGTWSINEFVSPQPVDPRGSTRNSLFCIPGLYLIEESSATSAGNLDWCLHTMLGIQGKPDYDEINRLVQSVEPQDSNVIFLPFLYGTNAVYPNAVFAGLTQSATRAELLRAVYEGVVFSHVSHIKKLLKFRDKPEVVSIAGGAANSKVWLQMFADCLALPVEAVEAGELGALGCAMAASVAAGVYSDFEDAARHMVRVSRRVEPDMSRTGVYAQKFHAYERLVEALSSTVK